VMSNSLISFTWEWTALAKKSVSFLEQVHPARCHGCEQGKLSRDCGPRPAMRKVALRLFQASTEISPPGYCGDFHLCDSHMAGGKPPIRRRPSDPVHVETVAASSTRNRNRFPGKSGRITEVSPGAVAPSVEGPVEARALPIAGTRRASVPDIQWPQSETARGSPPSQWPTQTDGGPRQGQENTKSSKCGFAGLSSNQVSPARTIAINGPTAGSM
jgi:hypothetical protein